MKTEELAREVISKLTDESRTLATAESCTGGLLGKLLTDIPGASNVYKGGDGTGRPVGLVYVALDMEGFSYCRELHLTGGRSEIRAQAAHEALLMLLEFL